MLPIELQEHILSYIHPYDKIYASMTCTLWANILKNQFIKSKKITCCSYDISTYFKLFENTEINWYNGNYPFDLYSNTTQLCSIKMENFDINLLNFLTYLHIKGKFNNPYALLLRYCETDCKLNEYVKYLIGNYCFSVNEKKFNMNIAISNHSLQIAKYLVAMINNTNN